MKQRFNRGAPPPEFCHFGTVQARAPYRKQPWRQLRLIDLNDQDVDGGMDNPEGKRFLVENEDDLFHTAGSAMYLGHPS